MHHLSSPSPDWHRFRVWHRFCCAALSLNYCSHGSCFRNSAFFIYFCKNLQRKYRFVENLHRGRHSKKYKLVFIQHRHILGRETDKDVEQACTTFGVSRQLTKYCMCEPSTKLNDYIKLLLVYGFDVRKTYLVILFCSWHWSFQVPQHKQLAKYVVVMHDIMNLR